MKRKLLSFFLLFALILPISISANTKYTIIHMVDHMVHNTRQLNENQPVDMVLYDKDITKVKSIQISGRGTDYAQTFAVPEVGEKFNGIFNTDETEFSLFYNENTSNHSTKGLHFQTNALKNNIIINIIMKNEEEQIPQNPSPQNEKCNISFHVDTNTSYISNKEVTKNTSTSFTIEPKYGYSVSDIKIANQNDSVSFGLKETQKTLNGQSITLTRNQNGSVAVEIKDIKEDLIISPTSSGDIYKIHLPYVKLIGKNTNTINFVRHGKDFDVTFDPNYQYYVGHINIRSNTEDIDIEPNQDFIDYYDFKAKTHLSYTDNVDLHVYNIKSDLTITPRTTTDRPYEWDDWRYKPNHPYYNAPVISNYNTTTNIKNLKRIGNSATLDVKVKTQNKNHGIEEIKLITSGNQSVTIHRFDPSFELNNQSYDIAWSEEKGLETAKFSVDYTHFLNIKAKATITSQIKNETPKQNNTKPSVSNKDLVVLKQTANNNTKITCSQNSPFKNGEFLGIKVQTTKKDFGIQSLRLHMLGETITIGRNQKKFKLKGQNYTCNWSYNDNKETLDVAIKVTGDLQITSNGANKKTLDAFKTSDGSTDIKITKAYMNGYNNTTFAPNDHMTRVQAIQMLTNVFLKPSEQTLQAHKNMHTYKDITSNSLWYAPVVGYAQSQGYLNVLPIDKNELRPDDFLTRAEMMALVYSFNRKNLNIASASDNPFDDVPSTHWANKYITLGAKMNWIAGYNGEFNPNEFLTRAQAVAIINRITERPVPNDLTNLKFFNDVLPSDWFYYDVLSATNDIW